MVDPISTGALSGAGPVRPATVGGSSATAVDGGFTAELRRQLEQVNRVQMEAEEGIRDLLTGQTDNITAVLATARKAEVAFSLLMEIRNKLVDAYTELKQLRV